MNNSDFMTGSIPFLHAFMHLSLLFGFRRRRGGIIINENKYGRCYCIIDGNRTNPSKPWKIMNHLRWNGGSEKRSDLGYCCGCGRWRRDPTLLAVNSPAISYKGKIIFFLIKQFIT